MTSTDGRLQHMIVPIVAVLAMAFAIILTVLLIADNASQTAALCHANVGFHNTFQAVINAVEHPPTLAGRKITPEQMKALHAYADHLRAALPPVRPCG